MQAVCNKEEVNDAKSIWKFDQEKLKLGAKKKLYDDLKTQGTTLAFKFI